MTTLSVRGLVVATALFILPLRGQQIPRFEESSALAGFTLRSGTPGKKYIIEANSSGLCLLDYDNDGRLDVYLVNGGDLESYRKGEPSPRANALFRNLGNRQFEDVTATAGVSGNGGWGFGCSAADFDGDGRWDLYVSNSGDNILYRNRGDGTFHDVTSKAGVNDSRWSTGSAWADFDRDGDLDLFVANYITLDPRNLPEPGSPSYGSMGSAKLGCQYFGLPVACGPRGLKGAGDSLFVNRGDGTFEERSMELGVSDPDGYYGLGVIWTDLNLDGWPELYVANDTTPNLLYENVGGRFEEIGLLSGAAASEQGLEQAGMGVASGDYLNSGIFSLYVTNFSEDYNTLYRNDGKLNLTDVTAASRLAAPALPYVAWGTFFFDFDNDGWLDLFVANGHVFPDADSLKSSAVAGYPQRNLLFRNLGNGEFQEVGQEAGLTGEKVSRGAVFGDLDNDGTLDVVVNNLDSTPTLLWNRPITGRHSLRIALNGKGGNRYGIGARVRVRTGSAWQSQEVRAGESYLSQNDFRLHFGLGSATQVDEVVVHWPTGKTSQLKDLPADQLLTVEEP